jgi:hypothetical protein
MGCTNAKSVQVHNGSAIHNKKNESKENEDINGLINSKNETEKGSVINYNRINEKSFGNFSSIEIINEFLIRIHFLFVYIPMYHRL